MSITNRSQKNKEQEQATESRMGYRETNPFYEYLNTDKDEITNDIIQESQQHVGFQKPV